MQQPNAPDLSQVRELPPFSLDAGKPYVWALLTIAALVASRIIWAIINNRGSRPSVAAAPPRCRVCDAGRMLPRRAVRYGLATQIVAALTIAAAGLIFGLGLLYGAFAVGDLLVAAKAGLPPIFAEWRIGNALQTCGVASVVIALSGSILLDRRVLACDACGACVDRA